MSRSLATSKEEASETKPSKKRKQEHLKEDQSKAVEKDGAKKTKSKEHLKEDKSKVVEKDGAKKTKSQTKDEQHGVNQMKATKEREKPGP